MPVPFVYDGDTEYVGKQGKRAYGIDAPEMGGMAGSEEAKARWTQLLAENPDATQEVIDTDKYGRQVVRYTSRDGVDLNAQMVREGFADPMNFNGEREYSREFIDRQNDLLTGRAEFGRDGLFVPPVVSAGEADISQEFGTGMKRGVMQTGMLFGAAIEAAAKALGLDEAASYGAYQMERYGKKAAALAPEVGSYKDVDDWTSGLKYVAGMLGENLPQFGVDAAIAVGSGGAAVGATAMMRSAATKKALGKIAPPIASAAFNRAVTQATTREVFGKYANLGLFGSQYAQAVGDAYAEQKENGIDEPTTALIAGLAPAGLDYATTKALLRTASRAAKNGNFKTAGEIVKEGVKHTGLQGANEALTELVNKSAVMYHLDGYDLFSDDNIEDMVNATLGGMLFGSITTGAIGGAAFIREKSSARVTPREVEAQNAAALGFDTEQSDIEEGVNVITDSVDGGHLEQTAPIDKVEQVAGEQAAAVNNAGVDVESQRVETPEETIARRAYGEKTLGTNTDHVPQTKSDIFGELQSLKSGARNTVLLNETDIPRLTDDAKALFQGMRVTTTNDGRMFVHHPSVTDPLSEALKASDPRTFSGDTFFNTETTPVAPEAAAPEAAAPEAAAPEAKQEPLHNQQVTPPIQATDEPASEAAVEPDAMIEAAKAQETEEIQELIQDEADATDTGATQNLDDVEGDSPQDFTEERGGVPFSADDYEQRPWSERENKTTSAEDVYTTWAEKDEAKKSRTTRIANRKRRAASLTDEDPIAERGELTVTAEKQKESLQYEREYDDPEDDVSVDDEEDDSHGAIFGGVVEGSTSKNNDTASLDIDDAAIESAVSASEAVQSALRGEYAATEVANKTAGELRSAIKEAEEKLKELRTRYAAKKDEVVREAGVNLKAELDAMKQQLAQLNSRKAKRIPKEGLDFKQNALFVDAGISDEPVASRGFFMPQVVADILGDWTTQGAGTANLAQNYLDKISDIVGYLGERGLKLHGDLNKIPLAYNGKGGFYYMKDLRKLAGHTGVWYDEYLGKGVNEALDLAQKDREVIDAVDRNPNATDSELDEADDRRASLHRNALANEAESAMAYEESRGEGTTYDDANRVFEGANDFEKRKKHESTQERDDEYAGETNKFVVAEGKDASAASTASTVNKKPDGATVSVDHDGTANSNATQAVIVAVKKAVMGLTSGATTGGNVVIKVGKLPKGKLAKAVRNGEKDIALTIDVNEAIDALGKDAAFVVSTAAKHEVGVLRGGAKFSGVPNAELAKAERVLKASNTQHNFAKRAARAKKDAVDGVDAALSAEQAVLDSATTIIDEITQTVDFMANFSVVSEALPEGRIAEVRGVGTMNVTVIIDAEKVAKNYPNTSGEIVRLAMAHELGHIFTREQFNDMPATVIRGLYDQFEQARAKVPANHVYNKKDGVGFDEFLADQFAAYVNGGASKIDAPAKAWFQKLMDGLRKIMDTLAPIFGRERLTPNESVMRFYDGMIRGKKFTAKSYDSWMTEAFATQAAPQRVRSFNAGVDLRAVLERKAMDSAAQGNPLLRMSAAGFGEHLNSLRKARAQHTKARNKYKKESQELSKQLDKLDQSIARSGGEDSALQQERTELAERLTKSREAFNRQTSLLEDVNAQLKEAQSAEKGRQSGKGKHSTSDDTYAVNQEPYALTVGDVLGQTSSVSRMVFTSSKQWLTDPAAMKKSFADFWDFTVKAMSPIFGTADGELRRMGAIGATVADLYKEAFADTHAMQAVWLAKLHRVTATLDEKTVEDFKAGRTPVPTQLRDFLNAFHNHLKDAEYNPTIGYVKDFFPRMYNFEEIAARREDFIKFLINQARKKGIPLSEAEAEGIASNMSSGDTMFTEFADVRLELHGPSFSHGKERTLDFVDDAELRDSGFAHTDPAAVLEIYVSKGIRQAEFLKRFGGWSTIGSEVAYQTRTGAMKNPSIDAFIESMLQDFPLRHPNGQRFTAEDKFRLITPASDPDFLHKNAALIAQMEKRGFIRRVKASKKGAYAFEFFDRNKHLRRYGGLIQTASEPNFRRFAKIVDAYEGRLGADELSPQARKLMSNVMAYQNATTMLLSGFASIPDSAGAIFRSRDFEGMADGMQGIFDAIRKESPTSRKQLMADLGFVENQMTTQALLEAMGLHHTTAGARKFNDVLFRINGTRALTNISRVALASVAEKFIARHAKRALNGDTTSTRYLNELGLTAKEANAINGAGFKFYNHYIDKGDVGQKATYDSYVSEKIHKAMARFVDSGTVRPNATMRPVWASDPRFMLIWHLKSFMYAYGKVILGGLGKEMAARWRETQGSKFDKGVAAAVPALVYAVPVLAMSALALGLRQQVQYEMWGDTPPTERMDWAEYTMEIVKRGGLLGPLEMGYSFVDATTSNRGGVSQLLGPTVGQLETILSFDAERILGRSVPVASQIPAIREWMLAGLGGD